MKLIVCVDDRGGMAFNGRRVTSDRVVSRRILALGAGKLKIAPYSRMLFADIGSGYDILTVAGRDDVCFLETEAVEPWLEQAEQIVIFCWNRAYPFDLQFPRWRLAHGWRLVASEDFCGNSHERVTMEVYEKC